MAVATKYALVLLLAESAFAHMGAFIHSAKITDVKYTNSRHKRAKSDATFRNPVTEQNLPFCHGDPAGDYNDIQLAVGDEIQIQMSEGAGHEGGHCSIIITEDEINWYKIYDTIDCTKDSVISANNGYTLNFTIPKNIPNRCGITGCTIGWIWSPQITSSCEIYSNCFDVVISGGTSDEGYKIFPKLVSTPNATLECSRPNEVTHRSPTFGPFIVYNNDGSVDFQAIGTAGVDCRTKTIEDDDTVASLTRLYGYTGKTLPPVGTTIQIGDECPLEVDAVSKVASQLAAVLVSMYFCAF